jgi:hypothetical protein
MEPQPLDLRSTAHIKRTMECSSFNPDRRSDIPRHVWLRQSGPPIHISRLSAHLYSSSSPGGRHSDTGPSPDGAMSGKGPAQPPRAPQTRELLLDIRREDYDDHQGRLHTRHWGEDEAIHTLWRISGSAAFPVRNYHQPSGPLLPRR